MSLPGLIAFSPDSSFTITSNQVDYDLFVAMGSPVDPIVFTLLVQAGVQITASDTTQKAFTASGFPVGSRCEKFINLGDIRAAGGAGGRGQDEPFQSSFPTPDKLAAHGGGGGGGAGTPAGVGGIATSTATAGTAGTASLKGTGGTTVAEAATFLLGEDGFPGGTAMQVEIPFDAVLNASGKIWGGGGGGGAGRSFSGGQSDGGDGGDPGQAGSTGFRIGGAAGKAVNLAGAGTFTFVDGGSDPQVKGAVS